MNDTPIRRSWRCAALASAALIGMQALAQAPSTAQVWDVRFVADSDGAFAAGPSATQVGITICARVRILPSTAWPKAVWPYRPGTAGQKT
ncbi:MAG: hypothetical protein AB7K52_01530 [Phycisphaerales bacterium]